MIFKRYGQRQRQHHYHRQQRPADNTSYFVKFLPLIVFILVSFLSNWLQSDPLYSFHQDG